MKIKTRFTNLIEKTEKDIRTELEKGITRNKVLPLDWAMDRINPIIEQTLHTAEKIFEEEMTKKNKEIKELNNLSNKYARQIEAMADGIPYKEAKNIK